MNFDLIVVGQGICGSFLSWYLEKAGYSVLVIDDARPDSASRIAAGIINPITGRRMVKTWMIDELLPFAKEAYESLGQDLGITAIAQKNIIDCFPTPQMRHAFVNRQPEEPAHLSLPEDEHAWRDYFRYDFGYGEIHPCYLVNLNGLLAGRRQALKDKGLLWEEPFDPAGIHAGSHHIHYKHIRADYLVFCDGVAGYHNPWFPLLPYAPNKGEALIIEAEGLPTGHIFKKGISLAPWEENRYWVGSSYEWEFADSSPTAAFRQKTAELLQHWLKVPFTVVDHKAAIRPANLERRPFVGLHPAYPRIGLLNGMGTKGCSLAPYYARQLTQHIQHGTPINPLADVRRFSRLLTRER